MQILSFRGATVFSGLAACVLAMAQPARAQVGMMDPAQALQRRAAQGAPDGSKPKIAPPPALPGAKPSETPAPPTQIPMDMSPNDALFDAINRGDIEGARDALSRGADLGARNILDMTPLELSVDLGRNDISFLLLSYRNGDTGRATAQAAAPPAAAPIRKASPERRTARTHHPIEPVKVAAPPQRQRLVASDGGAPVPAAGFLGFGPSRSAQ